MEQPSIKAIDKVSVARICSGQVITDLATAVKELVENSLDAGAKHVEVKLKEFGVDLIEVSDNGSGVSPSNYEGLALKYHTSKLSTFSDLTGVKSFGFRGEALSSLCELAGSFSVTTRATGESVGVKLSYGRNGKLLGKETAPRQVGTTVSISNMFEPLPVRRGEFRRNSKKQFNKLLRTMQAYALISLGVRITVSNTKTKGGKQTHVGTQYNNKLDDNVTNVFGAKFLKTLSPVSIPLPEEGAEQEEEEEEEKEGGEDQAGTSKSPAGQKAKDGERKIWGMVSKAGEGVGRADNDRQFLYLNGRPVDLPKYLPEANPTSLKSHPGLCCTFPTAASYLLRVLGPALQFTRAVSEVWRTYEMKQKPAFILDLRLPPGTFDVNVTPDKREIFMTGEAKILDCLKVALHKVWESSRYTIPVNQGQLVQARLTDRAFTLQDTPAKSSPAPPASGGASRIGLVPAAPVEDLVGEEAGSTRLKEGRHASGRAAETHAIASKEPPNDSVAHTPRDRRSSATETQGTVTKQIASSDGDEGGTRCARDSHVGGGQERSSDPVEGEDVDGQPSTSQRVEESEGGSRDSASTPATTGCNAEADDVAVRGNGLFVDADDTPSRTVSGGIDAVAKGARGASSVRARAGRAPCPTLAYDMQSILGGCRKASRLKRKRDARNASADSFSAKLSGCGTKDQDSMAAARAFSRVLHKEHFTQMRVVGQFNLGFMICLLGSDLFILDQHACDEKYNYEVLQQTTTIHQQPLVRPLPLETSASEEMTIIDNIAVFERNGFRFTVDDSQPTTKKLKITAIPFSKGTQFGVNDVHELASIVADNANPGEMARLPKARAMFASRACRSSIMIGKAMDKGQMARVVAKMATIEQPWNCPHGRPTMRHLADISKNLRTAAGLDPLLEA